MTAADMTRGQIYRRTRKAWPGSYYEIPALTAPQLGERLAARLLVLTGQELTLLKGLSAGRVLAWERSRFRDSEGRVKTSSRYVALPADLPVRQIGRKPTPR